MKRRKREVFRGIQVQPPIFTPAMAGGCGVPAVLSETVFTYNIPVYHSGDMLINIPPLKKFKAGDKVRVTVELERAAQPETGQGRGSSHKPSGGQQHGDRIKEAERG